MKYDSECQKQKQGAQDARFRLCVCVNDVLYLQRFVGLYLISLACKLYLSQNNAQTFSRALINRIGNRFCMFSSIHTHSGSFSFHSLFPPLAFSYYILCGVCVKLCVVCCHAFQLKEVFRHWIQSFLNDVCKIEPELYIHMSMMIVATLTVLIYIFHTQGNEYGHII